LVDGLPYSAYKNDEMRILIKLNITIGTHTLVDQFEWEINNPMNQPEEFARMMARDLSLSGEFTTAIAHQIREQSQMFTKSLFITSHPFDGRPIEDVDVRDSFLPTPIHSVFRPFQIAKEFTPYLYELSDADLQREELSILRDQRRQKRSVTRRGGPALPDLKDRERSIRSLVLSTVLPGAAESLETARVFKLSRSSGRGRRAGGRADDAGDSDDSESDESEMDADPAPQIVATARGRVIRGAASLAHAALKTNYGRSETPETLQVAHDQRSLPRRLPVVEQQAREESVSEPQSLIVKLKLPKDLFRQWVQNPKLRLDKMRPVSSRSNTPVSNRASQPPAAPPPHNHASDSPATSTRPADFKYDANGRVDWPKQPSPDTKVR
jgi:SWI/SNF-related matrix-associated actin-dependent regulator of chromatin subfamily B protein 1